MATCSCGGSSPEPAPLPRLRAEMVAPCSSSPEVSSPTPGTSQIYIELLLLEVPAAPPRDLRRASMTELLSEPDVRLLASPHLLATPGQWAELMIGMAGGPQSRFAVKPDLGEADRIGLDLDVAFAVPEGHLPGIEWIQIRRVVDVMAGRPSLMAEARTPVAEGRGVTAIVAAHVVRRSDDLRRVAACRRWLIPPPPPVPSPPAPA